MSDLSDTDLVQNLTQHLTQLGGLLMLSSSNLPIGSYTYSQGVESAIHAGLISDELSCLQFLQAYLTQVLGFDLALLALIYEAIASEHDELVCALSQIYRASRESKEFAFESQQLAMAMTAWLDEVLSLDVPSELTEFGYLPLFAHVGQFAKLSLSQTLLSYGFGGLENMTLAAVKTLPLGQMAGQRILWRLKTLLVQLIVKTATQIKQLSVQDLLHPTDEPAIVQADRLMRLLQCSSNRPRLAMLSSEHEVQYTRLFRS
ncbi:MAG: urease accessory UreF family protein [Moraxella sp.]|nr:urease accessory UreF family protein [Moraxella sp.]